MSTNKLFILAWMSLLSSAFCAMSALADVARPEAYQKLTAVDLNPGHAPGLRSGFTYLAGAEQRYGERLPLQLDGAIKKVKSSKYKKQKHLRPKARKAKAIRF
jgi:hypothetical protein